MHIQNNGYGVFARQRQHNIAKMVESSVKPAVEFLKVSVRSYAVPVAHHLIAQKRHAP